MAEVERLRALGMKEGGGDNVLQVSDEVESSRVCREGKVKRKLGSGRKNRWRP